MINIPESGDWLLEMVNKNMALLTAALIEIAPFENSDPRVLKLHEIVDKFSQLICGLIYMEKQDALKEEAAICSEFEIYEQEYMQENHIFSDILKHGPPKDWQQKWILPEKILQKMQKQADEWMANGLGPLFGAI